MKKKILRIMALMFALLMIGVSFVACGDDEGDDTGNNVSTNNGGTYKADVPVGTNYNNEEFWVYTYPRENAGWIDYDWYVTGMTGDTVKDAVFARSAQVEEELGIKIKVYNHTSYGSLDYLTNIISGGEDVYDIAYVHATNSFTLAAGGYTVDLNDYGCLDLDAPWWDQACLDGYSVGGKNFCLTGDIATGYFRSVGCIYYNKVMFQNYPDIRDIDIYKMVEDKTWTIEELYKMAAVADSDVDGDGAQDAEDIYGFSYFQTLGATLPIALGASYSVKNPATDTPVVSVYTQKMVDILDWYDVFLYDRAISFNSNAFIAENPSTPSDVLTSMFIDDRALFSYGEIHSLQELRSMESDFGILPMPLYDTDQESYHHTINAQVAAVMTVPTTNLDAEKTSYIVDSLGAASKNVLTPAYYDVLLQGIAARDVQSQVSLDIIKSTIVYDTVYALDRTVADMMRLLTNNRSIDMTSQWRSKKDVVASNVNSVIEKIQKAGN
ncbi:MAG: extracellular solute-binding protein [Clostridia bacterium]|nr:extracellular solute-binding protein [Clostridia bacterium]